MCLKEKNNMNNSDGVEKLSFKSYVSKCAGIRNSLRALPSWILPFKPERVDCTMLFETLPGYMDKFWKLYLGAI